MQIAHTLQAKGVEGTIIIGSIKGVHREAQSQGPFGKKRDTTASLIHGKLKIAHHEREVGEARGLKIRKGSPRKQKAVQH